MTMMHWGDRWATFRERDQDERGQQRLVLRTLRDRNVNTQTRQFFLREIEISFEIKNFAPGEELDELTFDGVNITPAGPLTANGSGEISGTFTIPANTPAGVKAVEATGSAGSWASATFTGQVIVREPPPPTRDVRNFDPVAQTFTLEESRWITSIDIAFRAKGSAANGVRVEIRSTLTGQPTGNVLAKGSIDGSFATTGWTNIPLDRPFWAKAGIEYSFTLRTDDNAHRVGLAELGKFDNTANQWVTSQPYGIGVLLKSSNNETWTPFQTQDLMFRIKCAKFTSNTRTVDLGPIRRLVATSITRSGTTATCTANGHLFQNGDTVILHGADQEEYNGAHVISGVTANTFQFTVDAGAVTPATGTIYLAPGLTSDLAVRGSMNAPTSAATVQFRYVLANTAETEYACAPNEKLELDTRIQHGMNLFMDLAGTETESPYVFEGLQPVVARLIESATYVSRAIPCTETDRIEVNYDAYIPSAASVSVSLQEDAPGSPTWSAPIALAGTEPITEHWSDYNHSADPFTNGGTETRVRLTLTGTPAARPALNELRLAALFTA